MDLHKILSIITFSSVFTAGFEHTIKIEDYMEQQPEGSS